MVPQLSIKEDEESEQLLYSFSVTGIRFIYRTCVRVDGRKIIKIPIVQP